MIVPGAHLVRTKGAPATAGVSDEPLRDRLAENFIPS